MYFEVVSHKNIEFLGTPKLKELEVGEVLVRRIGCGICRSDVGVYDSRESIPSGMFGHESIGVIEKSRSNNLKEGDFVASYWHPGYADHFVAKDNYCTLIPELSPKWTCVQPMASVLNALDFAKGDTIVTGRGFTTHLLRLVRDKNPEATLYFEDETKLESRIWGSCIEMSGNRGLLPSEYFEDEANMVWFSTLQSPVITNLFEWSWKAMNVHFPSPRQKVMERNMERATEYLSDLEPNITHVFKFEEAKKAFRIASDRTDGYFKGVFFEEGLL